MSTQSEDNLIDQSLRDVFRDYDLPPDAHPRVWEGVAERIATMPASSTGLSYRFLLPLTAAVGIGLGWLLPHPAAQPVVKVAAPTTQAAPLAPAITTAPAPAAAPLATIAAEATVPESSLLQKPAIAQQAARKQQAVAQNQPIVAQPASSGLHLDSVSTSIVQAAITPEVVVPADSAPTAALPAASLPMQPAATSQQAAPTAATKASKPTGTNEKIGYRKLSQRQPEGRRGIGRWVTRFFQGVRHLLG